MSAITRDQVDLWTPYTPLHDNVIIIPVTEDDERISEGGVHIPITAERAPTEGLVVAVGPGVGLVLPEAHMAALIDTFRPNTTKGSLLWIETRCLIEAALAPHPMEVKVGDRVLFPTWVCNWQVHTETGKRWACARVDQLLGVLT